VLVPINTCLRLIRVEVKSALFNVSKQTGNHGIST
jgi:hypothetical protein